MVVVVITEEVACSIADVEGMAVKRGGEPTMGSGTSPLEFGMASSSPSLSFSEAEPVLELVSISSIFARFDDYFDFFWTTQVLSCLTYIRIVFSYGFFNFMVYVSGISQ